MAPKKTGMNYSRHLYFARLEAAQDESSGSDRSLSDQPHGGKSMLPNNRNKSSARPTLHYKRNRSFCSGRSCIPQQEFAGFCSNGFDCIINIKSRRMQVLFYDTEKICTFVFVNGTKQVTYREIVCSCNRAHDANVKFTIVVNLVRKGCTCYFCVAKSYTYSGNTAFTTKLLILNHIWCNVVRVAYKAKRAVEIYLHLLVYLILGSMAYCPRWITYNPGSSGRKLYLGTSLYPSYRSLLFSFFAIHGRVSSDLQEQFITCLNEMGCPKPINYTDATTKTFLWPTKTVDIHQIKGWRNKNFHPEYLASIEKQESPGLFDTQLVDVYNSSLVNDPLLMDLEERADLLEETTISAFKSEHLDRYLNDLSKLHVSFPVPKPFAPVAGPSTMTEYRNEASSSRDESKESMYPVMPPKDQDDDPTAKCVSRSIKVTDRKFVMVQDRPIPITSSKYRSVKRKYISSTSKTETKEDFYRRHRIPFPLKTRMNDFEPKFSNDSFCELNEEEIKDEMQLETQMIEENEMESIPELFTDRRVKKPGRTGNARQYSLLDDAWDSEDAFQKRLKLPSENEVLGLSIAHSETSTTSDMLDCSSVGGESVAGESIDPFWKKPFHSFRIVRDSENHEYLEKASSDGSIVDGFAECVSAFKVTKSLAFEEEQNRFSYEYDTPEDSETETLMWTSQTDTEVEQVLAGIVDFTERNLEIPFFGPDPDLPSSSGGFDDTFVTKKSEKGKKSKVERELRKLVNVSVVDRTCFDDTSSSGDGSLICDKEFCRKGCVCCNFDRKSREPDHCGKPKCMFGCCCPIDTLSGSADVDSSLAREEQTWHQTFVKSKDKIELVPKSKDKIKREKKLPKRFQNHLVGKDVNNLEKIRTSPEHKQTRNKSSEVKEPSPIHSSDSEDSSANESSPLWRKLLLEEEKSSDETSSAEENERENRKTLRDRRLKLSYIARKANPKLIDIAIWCAVHSKYNCRCINWVVMLKNNALVWKPDTDESLSLSEMKDIPLTKSEYDVNICTYDPSLHSARTYGSLYDYRERNRSPYFKAKVGSEYDDRQPFSNGFVKIGVFMATKSSSFKNLKPADQSERLNKDCKYVKIEKTSQDMKVDIGGGCLKPKELNSKIKSSCVKRKAEDTPCSAPPFSPMPSLSDEFISVDDVAVPVKQKIRVSKSKSTGGKKKAENDVHSTSPQSSSRIPAVSDNSPSISFSTSSRTTVSSTSCATSPSTSRHTSPSTSCSSSYISRPTTAPSPNKKRAKLMKDKSPRESSSLEPKFKKPRKKSDSNSSSPPLTSSQSRNTPESTEKHHEQRYSAPSHIKSAINTTQEEPREARLPDHALICLAPDLGYLTVWDFSTEKLVLQDPETPGKVHFLTSIKMANDFLNKFLKKRMTFLPANLELKWIIVKPGVLKLKGSRPFDPKILKLSNIVTEEEIIVQIKKVRRPSDIKKPMKVESQAQVNLVNKKTMPSIKKAETIEFTRDQLSLPPTKRDCRGLVKDFQAPKKAAPKRSEVFQRSPKPDDLWDLKKPDVVQPAPGDDDDDDVVEITKSDVDSERWNELQSFDSKLETTQKCINLSGVRVRRITGSSIQHKLAIPEARTDKFTPVTNLTVSKDVTRERTPLRIPCQPNVVPMTPSQSKEVVYFKKLAPSLSMTSTTAKITPFSTDALPTLVQSKMSTPTATSSVATKCVSVSGQTGPKPTELQLKRFPVYRPGSSEPISLRTVFVPKPSQEPLKDIAISTNNARRIAPVNNEGGLTVRPLPAKKPPTLIPSTINNIIVKDGVSGFYDHNNVFRPVNVDLVFAGLLKKKKDS